MFEAAINEMIEANSETFGPISFHAYLEANGIPAANPAPNISIDSLNKLKPELREAGVMVFRLGNHSGAQGTHFGLAKLENDWSDYFLMDDQLLDQSTPEIYLPNVTARHIFPFQLLPRLTETSLVNLAVGSGILHHALGLGNDDGRAVPATGQSTFTFNFFPRSGVEMPWEHINGQVEIDALIVGRRNEKETLFLIEAKTGRPNGSLAKHKLCYPLAALRDSVPSYLEIVPIYLKTWQEGSGRHFLVTECNSDLGAPSTITELNPAKVYHGIIHGLAG